MKVFFISGPQAVGKMTIGEVISKKLDLPLLHNHMTLELIQPFLGWVPATFQLSAQFRTAIFNEIVKQTEIKGLIFTFVMAFDVPQDVEEINGYKEIFLSKGIDVFFVELTADLEERLRRNITENRLAKKPSKRNLEHSEYELLESYRTHRLNSLPGEIKDKHYFQLDVTNLTSEQAADKIIEYFNNW